MPATLLIYDIEHDGLRAKVANLCQDYGLQRVQYSAYAGHVSRTRAEELLLKAKRLAGTRQIDLRLFPICDRDLQQSLVLQQQDTSPDAPAAKQLAAGSTSPRTVPPVAVVSGARTEESVELSTDDGNDP